MAPRKPAARAKSATRSSPKSSDKVVKRPARGYHKFKNGLLNVTPKGGEKEIVRKNQDTPLLRLPAEIRNCIWEYVLGHKTFRATYHYSDPKMRLTLPMDEPGNSMALLRTCRQIYSETATMPLTLNTLAFDSVRDIRQSTKKLTAHQRRQLKSICFEIEDTDNAYALRLRGWRSPKTTFAQYFPALERIDVLVYDCSSPGDYMTFEKAEIYIRRYMESLTQGLTCKIVVKGLNIPMEPYYAESLFQPYFDFDREEYIE